MRNSRWINGLSDIVSRWNESDSDNASVARVPALPSYALHGVALEEAIRDVVVAASSSSAMDVVAGVSEADRKSRVGAKDPGIIRR